NLPRRIVRSGVAKLHPASHSATPIVFVPTSSPARRPPSGSAAAKSGARVEIIDRSLSPDSVMLNLIRHPFGASPEMGRRIAPDRGPVPRRKPGATRSGAMPSGPGLSPGNGKIADQVRGDEGADAGAAAAADATAGGTGEGFPSNAASRRSTSA